MSENEKAIGSGVELILEELALATGKAVLADLDATRAALAAEKARAARYESVLRELGRQYETASQFDDVRRATYNWSLTRIRHALQAAAQAEEGEPHE